MEKEMNLTNDFKNDYYNYISQFNVLTDEEELELFSKNPNENKIIFDKIYKHNLRLVASIAKQTKYKTSKLPLEDLIQYGNIGLMNAIKLFNINFGFKFSTYATKSIDRAIMKGILEASNYIKIPRKINNELIKYSILKRKLYNINGIEPTDELIAEKMNIDVNEVIEFKKYQFSIFSADIPLNYDTDTTLLDTLTDDETNEEYIDDKICNEEIYDKLKENIDLLNEKEKQVIFYRFGFYNNKQYTLNEISNIFNVSIERIRFIEAKAIQKLRIIYKR